MINDLAKRNKERVSPQEPAEGDSIAMSTDFPRELQWSAGSAGIRPNRRWGESESRDVGLLASPSCSEEPVNVGQGKARFELLGRQEGGGIGMKTEG